MNTTLEMNGLTLPFSKGQTVLEVARFNDIYIPTLCHHPKTGPLATCRICVVEVADTGDLQCSCRLQAGVGMKIRTDSDAVLKTRRTIVELLFNNGSHDCSNCGADGSCELQKAADQIGLEKPSIIFKRNSPPEDVSSPFISRRAELCINCGRCVEGCSRTVVNDVLGTAGRGAETFIICDEDLPMGESQCVQCGECVQLCPTGAIVDKETMAPRSGSKEQIETICPYCGVGCGVTLHVDRESEKVIGVTGTENHPVSDGMLCVKGRYGWKFIHHEDRLTTPLARNKDGTFRSISWEEAIAVTSGEFRKTVDSHGGESIAGLSSAKCTNEENYLFQKFFRHILGSNNVDHCARLCHASTVAGMSASIGSGAMTNDIAGIGEAEVILVIGSDTTTAHPVIASRMKQAVLSGGTKLIVLDPKKIDLARHADIYARHRCGTDVALVNGIINLIVRNGLEDSAFIKERCRGYEELVESVAFYTPEKVEEISGVPAETLNEIALLFGRARTAAVYFAMGITQHTTGTDNVRALVNLQLVCGNLGMPGGGINPLRGQCNVQGACDMGALPDFLPGYRRFTDSAAVEFFEKHWHTEIPAAKGLTTVEMIEAAGRGEIKAMYIMGENPAMSDPDITKVKKSLSCLDFLVVQDIFLTETARLADVVLPAACFAEKDGLYTNTERRVQLLRKAVDPPGKALPDWRIIQMIANKMGSPWNYTASSEIHEEVRELIPFYKGITWERVGGKGLQWPCPSAEHRGTPILHEKEFPIGRAFLSTPRWLPPPERTDTTYPFVLTTGRLLSQFHTGTMTRRSGMDSIAGAAVLISPKDAHDSGVRDGDTVEVHTRRGSIQIRASVTDDIVEGTLFMPFHFHEAAANLLTLSALDPVSKIPGLKMCAAGISKA